MIKVLGIPYDANSSYLRGPALAPPLTRLMGTEGSANSFSENGTEIVNGKNYDDLRDILFEDSDPARAFITIRQSVATQVSAGNKLLCLGGDHSVSYPIIDAFAEKYGQLHILHLDAHTDLYENFDNNPFSHASPFARIMEKAKVASLTQVGIRTLTCHQREQAEKFGVKIIAMKDFDPDFVHQLPSPLYISLDIDVLDPAFAPGVSHHEPGGLSTLQLLHIIQNIPANIVGADIVEYNPNRDINHMTAMVCYKLFKELIAKML